MNTRPPSTEVAVGVAVVVTALTVIGRPRYGANRSVRITGCRIEQMLDAVIAEMVGDPLADDIAVIAATRTGRVRGLALSRQRYRALRVIPYAFGGSLRNATGWIGVEDDRVRRSEELVRHVGPFRRPGVARARRSPERARCACGCGGPARTGRPARPRSRAAVRGDRRRRARPDPRGGVASITVRRRTGQFETVAASDTRAVEADEVQYRLGSGPCVDAVVDETVYCPHDLRHDGRWPRFGRAVADGLGVNSMLAYRMSLDGGDLLGCLNVYATAVDAFADDAVALGEVVATHAALLVSDASSRATVEHLRGALATNREIGVAMGVLMLRYKVTREEAFGLLRLASQNLNRKLRDIATEVADTGDLVVHRVDRPRSSRPTGTS